MAEEELRIAHIEADRIQEYKSASPTQQLLYFLRGRKLTDKDAEAVMDLLEARRIRREREELEREREQQ